jgi:hypothetical protein
MTTMRQTRTLAAGLLIALTVLPRGVLAADAEPAPPYPSAPPPRVEQAPPPRAYYPPPPPRRVIAPPPPLSPVMRAIYAPFYVAGLVIRYTVYYVIVAPIEVFSRTVSYGAQGGVDQGPPPPPPRAPEERS